MTRVLVTGGTGQVGRSIAALATDERFATLDLIITDRTTVDVTNPAGLNAAIEHHRPDIVINTAAYTAVDAAQTNEHAAHAVNTDAVATLADLCTAHDTRLVHLSTDYVFDGTNPGWYVETDPIAPLGVYGRTKAAGEHAARRCPNHLIVRTSWVYAAHGTNFVTTMLRLGAQRDELGVVDDQTGCPTSAHDLADALLQLATTDTTGTHHLAGRDDASWYQFADAIFTITDTAVNVTPIGTADYPTPAPRPANSRLDSTGLAATTGVHLPGWPDALPAVIDAIFTADPAKMKT